MTDRMTDQATPLTQESVDLLADVYGTQMSLTVYPSRLRAIEAAAARRAVEGSGVVSVEALAKALHAIGMGCWSPRGPGGALCKEVTEGNPLNDLHTPTAARILAALPEGWTLARAEAGVEAAIRTALEGTYYANVPWDAAMLDRVAERFAAALADQERSHD